MTACYADISLIRLDRIQPFFFIFERRRAKLAGIVFFLKPVVAFIRLSVIRRRLTQHCGSSKRPLKPSQIVHQNKTKQTTSVLAILLGGTFPATAGFQESDFFFYLLESNKIGVKMHFCVIFHISGFKL